jgi:hypothetical protein
MGTSTCSVLKAAPVIIHILTIKLQAVAFNVPTGLPSILIFAIALGAANAVGTMEAELLAGV